MPSCFVHKLQTDIQIHIPVRILRAQNKNVPISLDVTKIYSKESSIGMKIIKF